MARLTIYDRRERAIVTAADALLWPASLRRRFRRALLPPPRRILCFRLERIGDLLMTGPALAELRAFEPSASIDLVVGSWNREIATALPGIDRIETLDAGWLAREGTGMGTLGLARHSARWRSRGYDLAINFEPDIRTNLAIAAAGAARTVGFASGGGGALLDVAIDYDPGMHTIDNARKLVQAAVERVNDAPMTWGLRIPEDRRAWATKMLAPFAGQPKVGMHVSGGRAIKQWPEARFREVAEHLVRDRSAAIVLTGTPADRAQVEIVRGALPANRVIDLTGNTDLLTAAAVIAQLDLFVTGDTGPMHLANAVGTPIVAIVGPSDPRRYAPRGVRDTVVRIDLPCSPCNRIRRPPARCTGHTPDCLAGIEASQVLAAIDETLRTGCERVIALEIDSGAGPRRIDLLAYLNHAAAEAAQEDAYAWIKALRRLSVDGVPFRQRFSLRGDSLWWFAELFLHKEQAILNAMRTIAAFDAMIERDRPLTVRFLSGALPSVVAGVAAARKIRYSGPQFPRSAAWDLVRMDARARALAAGSRLSRLRAGKTPSGRARIAAFVHSAFWRSDGADGGAESYIGPVLRALEGRVAAGEIRYVGIGARTNFRARRWWDPIVARTGSAVVPIERYAPAGALTASRAVFAARHDTRRRLWASADLRAHAVIRGCDCWPLVRQQLAGIALLQFPWSARSMDEAAAALTVLEPDVAVTYAEAGGWGRALALECRRRSVPIAGLQHGFIYRHWLNYRHEPDETIPDPANPHDRGFPFPAATLLFDEHAARHLATAGRFPASTLAVTGSARLDELTAAVRALDADAIARVQRESGAGGSRALVLFAAKEREARPFLPALVDAVRGMPEVQLVVKPHPAETPGVYQTAVAGVPNIRVLTATAALPELLAAAGAVVTVNSTVAIDSLALGVPSVVIGLPNNLTPFVDAGLMLGAATAPEIRDALGKVLYNQEFRSRIRSAAGQPAHNDRQAASRSADAVLALAGRQRET